ncbi:MAG: AAA family ATPase [Pseudomonadota bacterium]
MYRSYYELKLRPFSKTPDPAFLYRGRVHGEALARLELGVEEREIVLLTGEIGCGKTTLSRTLVDSLGESHRIALIVHPRMSATQLLEQIAARLGVDPVPRRKSALVDALTAQLFNLDEAGLTPVVIIDEAQLISAKGVFDELRLLCNIQLDDRGLLSLVLIGQPELKKKLARPAYRAFAERIGLGFHLDRFDLEETRRYVAHRVQVAGRQRALFTEDAVAGIHHAADGVPRRINNIAANCLLQGFGRERDPVDAEIVREVVQDLAQFLGGIYRTPENVGREP